MRSKVSLAGVTIGRVAKIGVDSETAEAIVTMEVSDDVENLPVDTGARIQTEGFLGGRYISLIPGGEDKVLHRRRHHYQYAGRAGSRESDRRFHYQNGIEMMT